MMNSENRESFFIGLDIGSSTIKGVLTDGCGSVLAEAGAVNSLVSPGAGRVELDPEAHYRNVCQVLRELAGSAPGGVTALAMTAASGNTLLSGSDGVPSGPVISWMDRRCVQEPPEILGGFDVAEVRQVTGWPCVDTFPLAHLAWLKENEPERLAVAGHIGMDTDWLIYRLTGRWVMDHSTATTFHLQDQCSGTYHRPYLERLGVDESKLSALMPSGRVIGCLGAGAAGDTGLSRRTAVVSGCFDHPAAARATDVREPGRLLLSCGTSWVGFVPLGDRAKILEAEMLCDPFLSGDGGVWGGMFSLPRIGRNIEWYVDHLIAPGVELSERLRYFDRVAAEAPPGSGGLKIDLRQEPRRIAAEPARIARAVMEGAAHLLKEKLETLAVRGLRYSRAVMVGGPSRSPVWPGIVAEITGLEVRSADRSAGARGAALLAAEGVLAAEPARRVVQRV
jgi:sugar (pentulose or hexulose) kinase